MKNAKMKERIRAKAEANAKAREQAQTAFCNMTDAQQQMSEEEILKIFSTGEKVEKTPRGAKPPESNASGKKKKKGKK
jgi:hypothetical protein